MARLGRWSGWVLAWMLAALAACAADEGPGTPVWDPDAEVAAPDLAGPDPSPESPPDPSGREEVEPVPETEAVEDVAPELPPDTVTEAPCVPDCTNNECGEDGCGSLCGYCEWGFACKANVCVEVCVPACAGRECGDDGCGGVCGDCAANEFCGMDGTCVLKGCTPDCEGKQCGSDGCGSSCGTCPEGMFCLSSGECVADTSCHDVTPAGRCVGNELQWCDTSSGEGVLKKQECDPSKGLLCGYDSLARKYACVEPERCEPRCEGKTCGPDGCAGECGQCAEGKVCSTGGQCGDPCGPVTAEGVCEASTLRFCHKGILVTYDCEAAGKVCQFDPISKTYDCL